MTPSQPNITGVGTINSGTWRGDIILTDKGGTGLGTYAKGDIIYYSNANGTSFTKLPIGSVNHVLKVGSDSLPHWVAEGDVGEVNFGNIKISGDGITNSKSFITFNGKDIIEINDIKSTESEALVQWQFNPVQ